MKAEISVVMEIKYHDEITVNLPEGMGEDAFNIILDSIQRDCKYGITEDVVYILKDKYNIEVLKEDKSFPNSPSFTALEIDNMRVLDGEEE